MDYDLSHATGGNPYGVSAIVGDDPPDEHVRALARFQAGRLVTIADALTLTRSADGG